MSSPIAHCSLLFVAWPIVRRHFSFDTRRGRSFLLALIILAGLMAPDVDVLFGPLVGEPLRVYHNGVTHSLLVAVPFALVFAAAGRFLLSGRFLRFAGLGAAAYVSHVLIDWMTWGRGVQIFWPITASRFHAPVTLFPGVRHSVVVPWTTHALNLAVDVAFALLMFAIGRGVAAYFRRKGAQVGSGRAQSCD